MNKSILALGITALLVVSCGGNESKTGEDNSAPMEDTSSQVDSSMEVEEEPIEAPDSTQIDEIEHEIEDAQEKVEKSLDELKDF